MSDRSPQDRQRADKATRRGFVLVTAAQKYGIRSGPCYVLALPAEAGRVVITRNGSDREVIPEDAIYVEKWFDRATSLRVIFRDRVLSEDSTRG